MKIMEVISHRTFYKGFNPGDTRRISTGDQYWDSKLFVSSDPDRARSYGSQLRVFDATPDAKILYQGTRAFSSIAKGLLVRGRRMSLLDYCSEVVRRAEAAGYDAVWFDRQGDVGTAIINPEKFVERQA